MGSSGTSDGTGGRRGGGGIGRGNGSGSTVVGEGGVGRSVNPAMLESEFLAATGQAEAGMDGPVASLSLEEVPYDRDLR